MVDHRAVRREEDAPARSRDASELADSLRGVVDVLEHLDAEDEVERCVGRRDRLDRADEVGVRVFRGVEPDAKIIALTKKQSEFVRPIWDYINGAISAQRLKRGQEVAAEWSKTLAAVERTYGVPRQVVLGVWGMETNFGSFTGSRYV